MNSEDDTLLSGYIDAELDSDQQQMVEWALVTKPELAENVRALTAVRDLVAGLQRNTCADISPQVMSRIGGLTRSRWRSCSSRPWAAHAKLAAVVVGTLTAAAAIVLMVALPSFLRSRDVGMPAVPRPGIDHVVAGSQPGLNTAPSNKPGGPVVVSRDSSSSKTKSPHAKTVDARPLATEHDLGAMHALAVNVSRADRELSRRMLDNPAERRLFLIKSGADAKTRQQVSSVVEHTSRFTFLKITVPQGIAIDPSIPDEATVFALLVNPKEADRLRDQLKDAVAGPIEERKPEAGILTQLADIDQVQKFSPLRRPMS